MNQWETEGLDLNQELSDCLRDPHSRSLQEIKLLLKRVLQNGDYSYLERAERVLNCVLNNGHKDDEQKIELFKEFLLQKLQNFESKAAIFYVLCCLEEKYPEYANSLKNEVVKTIKEFLEK